MEWLGRLETTGKAPSPRKGHSMTRLLDSSMVLVFGGEHTSGHPLNDMYCLNIDTFVWRRIKYAEGPVPLPRLLHTATAISSSAMVVMFGDSLPEGSPRGTAPSPVGDVWYFDVRTCAWRQIVAAENAPSPRSCHSAVFGNGLGQVPAIYVFGGFGKGEQDGSTVYRLRIGDWKWEALRILFSDPRGRGRVEENPARNGEETNGQAPEPFPSERESHGAIWLPALNGMLIVAGDGGFAVVDDVWLFVPSSRRPGYWRWRKLNLKMARGLPKNKLHACAGFTLASLPTEKTQVLLWGGIEGSHGEECLTPTCSYLLDLDAMQTTRLVSTGEAPSTGRLLHGFVRAGNLVFAFGGCDNEGNVLEGLEYAILPEDFKSVGLQATDFGPVAADVAAGKEKMKDKDRLDLEEPNGKGGLHRDESEMDFPLTGPSVIPKGTPLSGRIIEETDHGYFVSVVINGKLYKGVLVANPLKNGDLAQRGAADGAGDDKPKGEGADTKVLSPAHREPKRRRIDPTLEALPDSPPRPLNNGDEPEVIEL